MDRGVSRLEVRSGAAAPTTLAVLVDTPRHAGLDAALNYRADRELAPGTWVRVPLGRRTVLGLVWAPVPPAPHANATDPADPPLRPVPTLRPITEVLDALPPMTPAWCELLRFAAGYYQRSPGEVAMAAVPPELRSLEGVALGRRLAKLDRKRPSTPPEGVGNSHPASHASTDLPAAQPDQTAAVAAIVASLRGDPQRMASNRPTPEVWLLHGVTGSGKTEVYLQAASEALQRRGQVLVLVPEINLTPQLQARFEARFAGHRLVALHSGLTPAQRLRHWLLAHRGEADLVLGTRLAIWASMPRLALIVVDEEHDPSYKQQEGARYSARDLAVLRGRLERCPVVLGSATPSLETWQNVQTGRYRRLPMPRRIGDGALPSVRLVDLRQVPKPAGPEAASLIGLAPALLTALQQRIDAGEQSLVLLNRRGYATALHCADCGWKSACAHCSAWRVFHKSDRSLRCHHCGITAPVPRACPDCGNLDIAPVGRGTERLEEQLAMRLRGRDGKPLRIARIDADSTRLRGSLQAQLAEVHAGEVDVLVGTQMVTKGHDFRRITLVAAVNPDGALFSADFRAAERLFALLMQAGGRAGRDAAQAARSELWIQTWHPRHPLFAALARHDFEAFAAQQLDERRGAGLPPFTHLALLRAEARDAATARAFLADAGAVLSDAEARGDSLHPALRDALAAVQVYPPVPMTLAKVADVERAQMLVESSSRVALQAVLAEWLPQLQTLRARHRALLRWAVDVDPMSL
jgi:primosomal protein N' (replication factor Y) (superfamily II helicase)